jgi:hypothetical protein
MKEKEKVEPTIIDVLGKLNRLSITPYDLLTYIWSSREAAKDVCDVLCCDIYAR